MTKRESRTGRGESPGHSTPGQRAGFVLNRRTLMTGGLAGAAGAVALIAPGQADAATGTPVTFGPVPSGGDDTAALQAALPTAGVLLLPSGTYKIAGVLTLGTGQDIQGQGGGSGLSATILKCTAAGASVVVSASGGITGGFRVDGNSVATAPFVRNGGTGQWLGRTLQDITVTNSAQDGITCLGAQNDAWYKVVSISHARDCWVLDQGYGGALFSRCEIASGGRYNLRLDTQVSGGPYNEANDCVFHQCIVEYTQASTVSVAYVNGATNVKFDHTSFYASVATTGPVVEIASGATLITFEDTLIQSTPSTVGGIGLRVGAGSSVVLSGLSHLLNFAEAIHVRATTATVDVKGQLLFSNCTAHYAGDAGVDPTRCVTNLQTEIVFSQRQHPADLAYVSSNPGAGFFTFEDATGRRVWGTGADTTGDVALSRRTVGILGVDQNQVLATGTGSTATRPYLGAPMAGAIRFNTDSQQLEVTDGGAWYAPSIRRYTMAASGTFVVPAGVTKIHFKALGGGGGGSGGGNMGALSLAPSAYGGAGGGAGMVIDLVASVIPGETLTVLVGAGGAGGAGAAPAIGLTGNASTGGTAGGTTVVTNGAGNVLVAAGGGGGGAPCPGVALTGPVPPVGAGSYACNDYSYWVSAPGCGSFANYNAIPAAGGVCGGASGAPATAGAGGGPGWAPNAPGQQAVAGWSTNPTSAGSDGASPFVPGCGGNGGGAGGAGGAGGHGGSGSSGGVEMWWVS